MIFFIFINIHLGIIYNSEVKMNKTKALFVTVCLWFISPFCRMIDNINLKERPPWEYITIKIANFIVDKNTIGVKPVMQSGCISASTMIN